ncbi:hypothetical protein [Streptomyces californicus]|uniref:hypothetical protein n=1 Tax=Streptomyces californicus TaxID=67351 RepID=UPI0036739112
MKALTIRQPWAGAIVHQTKRVENRSWKLPAAHHGTRILIHAGTQLDKNAQVYGPNLGDYGAIIGIATIIGYHWSDDGTCCGSWGFANIYHWELADVTALPKPVPAKGALGFWTPPADVLDVVLVQQAVTS